MNKMNFSFSECFDHLSIITLNENGDENIEGQFCGTTLKEKSLCFNTGQLSMRLVTDRMWNTRGFKVSYLITGLFMSFTNYFQACAYLIKVEYINTEESVLI